MPTSEINNLRDLLERRARAQVSKTFLFSEADSRRWSYEEFNKAVNWTANLLLNKGISKGDVVSLLLPNSPEYIIAYFACFKVGALAGPVNSLLKPAEIEWVVGNSESKLMLVGSQFADLLPKKAGDHEDRPFPPLVYFDNVADAVSGFDDDLKSVDLSFDDEAIIIYTSGTTGKPKGCLLTHGNVIANARQIVDWLGFTENDRLLTLMPLFHMNAVSVTTMSTLYAGASTVVSPKFSASRFWDIVDSYQITSFGSVATMLSMLLNPDSQVQDRTLENPQSAFRIPQSKSLRFAMCGSAPVPAEVLKNFEEKFDCLVIEGYGLSESTCRSTFNPPNEKRRPGSCGLPIGNEMKVFDENDEELPDGELGEIVLRGDNIFKGYFKNEEATVKAFANGWFHTGDVGYRDEDGFFYIADRKTDMIIRGGENIYPREIDELLYTHPSIAEAAVIGIPDELYGEEVAAFVVLKEDKITTESDLMAFCSERLADYKCPKTFTFVTDIPKGPTGKLLKRELSKLFQKL